MADLMHAAAPEVGIRGISVSGPEVGRWERGERWPRPHYVQLLCHVFGTSPAELGLVKRRDFLKGGAGFLATAPILATSEPWERLLHALSIPAGLDDAVVTEVEAQTANLHQLEQRWPARQLFGRLTDHLDRVTELIRGSLTPSLRRRLVMTAGDTSVLGGWLAWDMGDRPTASRMYEAAATAAREAEDPALYACILAYLSYGATGRTEARDLLRRARRHLDEKAHPVTVAWIECRTAEESASLGDTDHALQQLEHGLRVYENGRSERERVWTGFLDRSRLGAFAISTYARLGRPDAALKVAAEVAPSLDGDLAKNQVVAMAAVADVQLQQGNFSDGLDFAEQALMAAVDTETTVGLSRLQDLCRHLGRLTDVPEAHQLEERIHAACG